MGNQQESHHFCPMCPVILTHSHLSIPDMHWRPMLIRAEFDWRRMVDINPHPNEVYQECPCLIFTRVLWMVAKPDSHHFETIGSHYVLVFTEESPFRGFLGGASFRPSTVCAIALFLPEICRDGRQHPANPQTPRSYPDPQSSDLNAVYCNPELCLVNSFSRASSFQVPG